MVLGFCLRQVDKIIDEESRIELNQFDTGEEQNYNRNHHRYKRAYISLYVVLSPHIEAHNLAAKYVNFPHSIQKLKLARFATSTLCLCFLLIKMSPHLYGLYN